MDRSGISQPDIFVEALQFFEAKHESGWQSRNCKDRGGEGIFMEIIDIQSDLIANKLSICCQIKRGGDIEKCIKKY